MYVVDVFFCCTYYLCHAQRESREREEKPPKTTTGRWSFEVIPQLKYTDSWEEKEKKEDTSLSTDYLFLAEYIHDGKLSHVVLRGCTWWGGTLLDR